MKKVFLKKGLLLAACGMMSVSAAACGKKTEPAGNTANSQSVQESVQTEAEEAASEGSVSQEEAQIPLNEHGLVTNPEEALEILKSGNDQFSKGAVNLDVRESTRKDLAENGQHPHTVVITCSDSRVSPELIFDLGIGEEFVIRTAGNVVSSYEIGSVEYAVEHLNASLILVMGHSQCGAVGAALEGGEAPGYIADIVKEIAPSVEKAKAQETDEAKIADVAENFNVENSVEKLMESQIISDLVKEGKVNIIGSKYDISTGTVKYFE